MTETEERKGFENSILFGKYQGEYLGLSLDSKKTNRSLNTLVIGSTGTGKTYRYVKPNILQENSSAIITDPSADLFRTFAPYLLRKGYSVSLFSINDVTLSNHYNPLSYVYNSDGQIDEVRVSNLVDVYMKNSKAGFEVKGSDPFDPFWYKSEKAFITAMIFYVLENDNIPREEKCFGTVLEKVQMAKVLDDEDVESPLTKEMNEWFESVGITDSDSTAGGKYKTKLYYDTFLIAPQKTANTIFMTTAVNLQIFAMKDVDFITHEDVEHPENNINICDIATQQGYLFLGIPQAHHAFSFLIEALYMQIFECLYTTGEHTLRGKWFMGYRIGTSLFNCFDSEEEALDFYKNADKTKHIMEDDYINGTKIYRLIYKGKVYKYSFFRDALEKYMDDFSKMVIWSGDDYSRGDPALPVHVNVFLDEFSNIGEISNFSAILATSHRYGIGIHIVVQSMFSLERKYPYGEYKNVLANVDTIVYMGSPVDTLNEVLEATPWAAAAATKDILDKEIEKAIRSDEKEFVFIRDMPPYLCDKIKTSGHKNWNKVQKVRKAFDPTVYYKANP